MLCFFLERYDEIRGAIKKFLESEYVRINQSTKSAASGIISRPWFALRQGCVCVDKYSTDRLLSGFFTFDVFCDVRVRVTQSLH